MKRHGWWCGVCSMDRVRSLACRWKGHRIFVSVAGYFPDGGAFFADEPPRCIRCGYEEAMAA